MHRLNQAWAASTGTSSDCFVSATAQTDRARFDGACMLNVLGYKVLVRIRRYTLPTARSMIQSGSPAWFGSGKVMTVGLRFPVRAAPCRSGQATRKKKASRGASKHQTTGQSEKNDEKKRAPQWPVRGLMAVKPITTQAPKASHRAGPTLGLNQPVTSVKRHLAPRPSNHIFAFSLVLFREPCHLPSTNQSAVARPAALPCPTNEQRKSKPDQRAKKGPFPRSRVQSDSSAREQTKHLLCLAGHSQRLDYLVPIRLPKPRASERKP